MKYHAFLKFLAVLLCAAALLGTLAGGLAIVGMGELQLFEYSVDQVRKEQLQSQGIAYADILVGIYASQEVGGCPENLVAAYYGDYMLRQLYQGAFGYAILDANGELIYDRLLSDYSGPEVEIPVETGRYLRCLGEKTEPVPESTQARVEESEEARTEATQALTDVPEEDFFELSFFDTTQNRHRQFRVSSQETGPYRVKMQFPTDAVQEQAWELARLIQGWGVSLFWFTGICAVCFGAMLVYLCFAAGHRRKQSEVRAGGLNRLPLDLYAGCAVMGVMGLGLLGYEAGEYLARQDLMAALYLVGMLGYGAALLVVCFLFALAAQVKTPGGFWWRNTLCGWCCKLVVFLWNLAVRILTWGFAIIIRLCKWAWTHLPPLGKRAAAALWKLVRFFWFQLSRLGNKLFVWLGRALRFLWAGTSRFVGMLPLTWQWLLAAFLMIFVLVITVNSYRPGVVVMGMALVLALVLYGASSFGTLLESTKRMRKGDLDTKVDDRFLVGSFRDFSRELNGLADVAVVAAQKQLKSERMKTELITNVSHDIKTPLTSIINYVDLLEKPHTPQEQEQYLEVLHRQSQRLKKLIDDLMEMSKASSGNIAVELERVNAVEAVNQALGEFADKLEKVPLHPVFRHPEQAVMVRADGKLTWRVLSNVLSNAVKYALPGTRLYVDMACEDGQVSLSLKNISRDALNVEADELMERFVRGDASRNTEGSGLGLNIAKSLMELQQGTLQLLIDGDLFKVTLTFPEDRS